MRIIKSVVAIYLSLTISAAINGSPSNAAIAAFICTKSNDGDTKDTAKYRVIGTIIGAVYSMVSLFAIKYFNIELFSQVHFIILSLLMIPAIKIILLLKIPNRVITPCVVIILLTHLSYIKRGDPYMGILYRFLDTAIGVVVAVIVNKFLPHNKAEEKETEQEANKKYKEEVEIEESVSTKN